ncbi:MAG TPA: hypothetical protein VEU30_14530 [Thermoanaerobaculia bacterium]|nr:hypothetical protein [Thermoanaerobaculia bacterium]
MEKPLRLLVHSLKQFAIGFGPAIAMAFVCLVLQIGAMKVVSYAWLPIASTISAARPERSLDEMLSETLSNMGRVDWYAQARDVIGSTLFLSVFFFFHALVALILTSWLLRRRAGFDRVRVLRRALRGAGLLSLGTAVVYGAAYFVDDVLPATRYVQFNFDTAAMVGIWFGGTALLLPARLMGHEPVAASGFLRNTLVAGLAMVPWFYASEVLGAPIRHCRECGGFFEGIFVFLPVLGFYLLGLTVSSAAVSAAACMPAE